MLTEAQRNALREASTPKLLRFWNEAVRQIGAPWMEPFPWLAEGLQEEMDFIVEILDDRLRGEAA